MSRVKSIQRSSPLPLFYQLAEDIKRRIDAGEFPVGGRLATVRELARSYGVSFVTARRAVTRLVDEKFVQSRPGRGTVVVRARGNPPGDGITTGLRRVVVLWPTRQAAGPALQAHLFAVIDGMRAALPGHTLSLELADALLLDSGVQGYLDALTSAPDNAGFFLVSAPPYVKRYFEERGVPVVVLGDVEAGIRLPFVASNEEKAHYELTRHLVTLSHERIAQVVTAPRVAGHEARVRGYRRALADAGLTAVAERRDLDLTVPSERNLAGLAFRHLLASASPPTAAICTGAVVAGWLRAVAGDRVHLAYDVHGSPHEPPPPRTSLLIWPGEEMGYAAGRLLWERIAGGPTARSEVLDYLRIEDH